MVSKPGKKWAAGAERHIKRPQSSPKPATQDAHPLSAAAQREVTGIYWDEVDFSPIKSSATPRALARFRASLPELIWNAAALEGNTFTLNEVRTLLDGVTVGGRKIEDEQQVLALSEAYNRLESLVAAGEFRLGYETTCELHRLVAEHESLDAGMFRGEGSAHGGGTVRLAAGGAVEGRDHGPGGAWLRDSYEHLVEFLIAVPDVRERALVYFCATTRHQFFFDGNKRTARLMMTGELMANGFDAVNVPNARRLEFNVALDHLFTTDDATPLLEFLVSCASE